MMRIMRHAFCALVCFSLLFVVPAVSEAALMLLRPTNEPGTLPDYLDTERTRWESRERGIASVVIVGADSEVQAERHLKYDFKNRKVLWEKTVYKFLQAGNTQVQHSNEISNMDERDCASKILSFLEGGNAVSQPPVQAPPSQTNTPETVAGQPFFQGRIMGKKQGQFDLGFIAGVDTAVSAITLENIQSNGLSGMSNDANITIRMDSGSEIEVNLDGKQRIVNDYTAYYEMFLIINVRGEKLYSQSVSNKAFINSENYRCPASIHISKVQDKQQVLITVSFPGGKKQEFYAGIDGKSLSGLITSVSADGNFKLYK